METRKLTNMTDVVAMEEVDAVEKDMVAIHIDPTTPGTVLISE